MSGREWTQEEVDLLRAEYKRGTAERLARRMGRSVAALRQKAVELGLRIQSHRRGEYPPDLVAFIRERRKIGYIRTKVLGLPLHTERIRERKRDGYRKQLETLAVGSLTDITRRARQRRSMTSGWPLSLRLRPMEVTILDVLADGVPRTRREIAEVMGVTHRAPNEYFHAGRYAGPGGCVLAYLVRRRLVSRSRGRSRRGEGLGRSQFEYWLPIDTLRMRKGGACKGR